MRLYIIRHADPDYPNNTITLAGHLEAQALAKRMAKEEPDYIYCSPLGRAIDTMRYSAELLRLEPAVEEWMSEISDCTVELEPWGQMTMWDVPGEVLRGRKPLPGNDDWYMIPCLSDPKLASKYEEVQKASDAFLSRHGYKREDGRYRCIRPNRDKVAVFCHGGLGLTWLAHLLEIPLPIAWSGFWLPPSSVTTILFDERSPEWAVPRCLAVGDVSHLYAAGLPVRPRGIAANYY
jgi:broad specificity phosphatase PhoE